MRPSNEYRIQPKIHRLDMEHGYITLLLGWWDEGEVFAGFDARKHEQPAWSASIQVKIESLRSAYINGFATSDKGNEEIAIAFRSDFFMDYVQNLNSLHDFGRFTTDRATMDRVIGDPGVNDESIPIANNERRNVVISVRKRLRDINFQDRVLTAYSNRCAICGIQLKLVQAAHIVPVSDNRGTDETSNGLALCALHHLAYDQSLLTINPEYAVILNPERTAYLESLDLAAGLDKFVGNLRQVILLPPEIVQRPRVDYIRLANQIRGWKI